MSWQSRQFDRSSRKEMRVDGHLLVGKSIVGYSTCFRSRKVRTENSRLHKQCSSNKERKIYRPKLQDVYQRQFTRTCRPFQLIFYRCWALAHLLGLLVVVGVMLTGMLRATNMACVHIDAREHETSMEKIEIVHHMDLKFL